MERRDPVDARAQAIREQIAAHEAVGADVPDHLRKLADSLGPVGELRETRADVPVGAKGTPKKSPHGEGTGYFFEDGHGEEPKHADSTDKDGYHVARPDNAPGVKELPSHPHSDTDAVEPVEKYPDFANPGKVGDEVPQAARDRGIVPEGTDSNKPFTEVVAEREAERAKVHQGLPTDPDKALNPTPASAAAKRVAAKKAAPGGTARPTAK